MKLTLNDIKRFWEKVDKTTSNKGCWLWTAGIDKKWRYGLFRVGKRMQKAHRVSWTIHNGTIPNNLLVLHRPIICHEPSCVNPGHLYIGDSGQNVADMKTDGTLKVPDQRGDKGSNHKLTGGQVAEIRQKYIPRQYTQQQLAEEYGVSRAEIGCIVNRNRWKHI